MKAYDVYIMASRSGVLYIGVTGDLETRVQQHKKKLIPGFTSKYNVNRLVWHEAFHNISDAISREKELKGWRRSKKVALIEETNPKWLDLAEDTGSLVMPVVPVQTVIPNEVRDLGSRVHPPVIEIPHFVRDDMLQQRLGGGAP